VPDRELVRPIGKAYPLPAGFQPSALRPLVSYPNIRVVAGGEWLEGHPEALASLDALFAAAHQAGINDLAVVSAYRSRAAQAAMWQSAGGSSQRRVAPPGTSEHESGLAFDLAAASSQAGFVSSPASVWVRANAHLFGFVSTYARSGIDGIGYEPWHYRYVGTQTSKQLVALGYLDPGSLVNPIEFYAVMWEKSRR
jgi:D-alanyl-D-alanine carboxypeptidase